MIERISFSLKWRMRQVMEKMFLVLAPKQLPIIIYTMGKVGSTSVYYALKKKFGSKVSFVHRFYKENIDHYDKAFLANGLKPHRSDHGRFIYSKIENREFQLITLIRNPLERNISEFFQDFKVYNCGEEYKNVSISQAITNFKNQFPHDMGIIWLLNELCRTVDVEFQDLKFESKQKFGFQGLKNCNLLIIRSDLEDTIKVNIINDFTNSSLSFLTHKNQARDKGYFAFYNAFIEEITFSKEYINEIYRSDIWGKFFTEKELIQMKSKWTINNHVH